MPNLIRGIAFPPKSDSAAAQTPNRHETTSDHESSVRLSSVQAAEAVLGGRFHSVREARTAFPNASPQLAGKILQDMRASPASALMAQQATQAELDRLAAAVDAYSSEYDVSLRSDMEWINDRFEELLLRASSSLIHMIADEQHKWAWCFEETPEQDRRFFSHAIMYAVWTDLQDTAKTPAGYVHGGAQLELISKRIFGDCSYSIRTIKDNAGAGISSPKDMGRPTSFPRPVELVLFRFIAVLRSQKYPVFKETVIEYGKSLIAGTEYSLNFAKVKDGRYVPCEHGGVEWDEYKLDNWFYRRFIGDRAEGGARMANQGILDLRAFCLGSHALPASPSTSLC
jgi:hypothetical protein